MWHDFSSLSVIKVVYALHKMKALESRQGTTEAYGLIKTDWCISESNEWL